MIQLIMMETYQALSEQAAKIVANQIHQKPNSIIGFATGSTPLGLYETLVTMYQNKEISFSEIQTFNLDEYVGLRPTHPQSYFQFMMQHLFSKVDIKRDQIHFPAGVFANASRACLEFEEQLEQVGSIDLQILGIGENGHIGFNEPADAFTLNTHITGLAERTIQANARFFHDQSEVPRKAITMGIGNIMAAKKILLLADKESKSAALSALFSGTIDPNIPASILQLHPNVVVIVNKKIANYMKHVSNTLEV